MNGWVEQETWNGEWWADELETRHFNLSSESSLLYSDERVNQIRMGKQVLKNKA